MHRVVLFFGMKFNVFLLLLAVFVVNIEASHNYFKVVWHGFILNKNAANRCHSFHRIKSLSEKLLPSVDSSNLTVSIRQWKSLKQSEEVFDQLRISNQTIFQLDQNLYKLKDLNIFRTSVPDDVVRSINEHIVRLEPLSMYTNYSTNFWVNMSKSLSHLQWKKDDFSLEARSHLLSGCCKEIKSSPKCVLKALALSDWFTMNDLKLDMICCIDRGLSAVLPGLPKFDKGILRSLAFLRFSWSWLSPTSKTELLRLLNLSISEYNEQEFRNVLLNLVSMQATYEDIKPISSNILRLPEKYCISESYDADGLIKIFECLGRLKFPYNILSVQLRLKMEEACIAALRRWKGEDVYALHFLNSMKAKFSYFSTRFVSFIRNDIPNFLSTLPSDQISRQLKLIANLKVKWDKFSSIGQEIIISSLVKKLGHMNDREFYFAIQALIQLLPRFDTLPSAIQQYINKSLPKQIELSSSNGFCSLLNSLGKMEIKYSLLSNEVKNSLNNRLMSTLPKLDNVSISIILHGLAGMGMKTEDFPEELKSFITTWLQNNKIEQHLSPVDVVD